MKSEILEGEQGEETYLCYVNLLNKSHFKFGEARFSYFNFWSIKIFTR